jgi:hypothetical protein
MGRDFKKRDDPVKNGNFGHPSLELCGSSTVDTSGEWFPLLTEILG